MGKIARIPLGLRILAGLLLGLLVGIVLPPAGAAAWSDNFVAVARTGGQLWLSALQMTVLPLVFALLALGLGRPSKTTAGGGLIARRATLVFAALYAFSLVVAVSLNALLLAIWPVSPSTIEAFKKFAGTSVEAKIPPPGEIILGLVPSNVFASLAAGSILPVVVFAILFGLGMRHIAERSQERVAELVEAISDIMFMIVRWILELAPIGAFGLVVATAHETGVAMLWGLATYLRHLLIVVAVMLALAYPVAALWGRTGFWRFAKGAAPSQLVAASTQSSVGSLPVMLESTRTLGVSDDVSNVTLPLAVSVFRFSGPTYTLTVAAYAAAAAGLSPDLNSLALASLLALLMEFAAVGLPNQVSFIAVAAPAFAVLGAPLGFLPVMLAVDTIPDIVGTTANVTGDLAAATVVAGRAERSETPASAVLSTA
jgi:Na+/H+-dicarboxylate symporter